MQKKDLTNKRYGKLLVIEQDGKDKSGHLLWKCECDCGNITYATTSQLNNGLKSSCGCAHYEKAKKEYRKKCYNQGISDFAQWVIDLIFSKSEIKSENSVITATPEELQDLIKSKLKEVAE